MFFKYIQFTTLSSVQQLDFIIYYIDININSELPIDFDKNIVPYHVKIFLLLIFN